MRISNNTICLLVICSFPVYSQVLSTPDGTVSSNGTTDHVFVNGNTKLINPNGRTLTIERDDEDSWLMFHDPNNYWFSMGIDRSNNGAFTLNSGGELGALNQFVMTSAGNIGIGKVVPSAKLDVNGHFQVYPCGDAGLSGALKLRVVQGSSASIIEANSDYVWADHDIYINAANSSSGNLNQLVVHRTGNVGIGTPTPNEKLTVNGTIYGKEVRVDLSVPGPDYVLPSLQDIEKFINDNKHLPEIPSAANMEANGIEVGIMNMLLLKKVEELTLYVIEQNKVDEEHAREIQSLRKEVSELKG